MNHRRCICWSPGMSEKWQGGRQNARSHSNIGSPSTAAGCISFMERKVVSEHPPSMRMMNMRTHPLLLTDITSRFEEVAPTFGSGHDCILATGECQLWLLRKGISSQRITLLLQSAFDFGKPAVRKYCNKAFDYSHKCILEEALNEFGGKEILGTQHEVCSIIIDGKLYLIDWSIRQFALPPGMKVSAFA